MFWRQNNSSTRESADKRFRLFFPLSFKNCQGKPTKCYRFYYKGSLRSVHKISYKILLLLLSLQRRFNVWAECPTGYFLQGLWRNDGVGWLYQIEEAKCCKPKTLPDKYGHCYNENIWGSFDHYGLSECKRGGYYVAGLYKSNCNTLGCIEMLRCCSMFIGESS